MSVMSKMYNRVFRKNETILWNSRNMSVMPELWFYAHEALPPA